MLCTNSDVNTGGFWSHFKNRWQQPQKLTTLKHIYCALSQNFREKYPYSQTPAISRGCTEGKAKTRGLGVWLSQSLTFGNLASATRILSCPSPTGPRAAVGSSPLHIMIIIPLHIMIIIPNFREIKFYFLEKKLSRGFPT